MKFSRRRPDLSVIVVAYNMRREVPRTLRSLSRSYQSGVQGLVYETIVVDNGSPEPLDDSCFDGLEGDFRLVHPEHPTPSPATAANYGVRLSKGHNLCIVLDGARMVTPGVVAGGLQALTLSRRAFLTTMAWHLGAEHQSVSVGKGYDSAAEDTLLDSVAWPEDGYRLFEISSLAGSNPDGMCGDINESCCLMLSRELWDEVGGYDEAFDLPGGGLVNLDLFSRLLGLPGSQLVVLLGEGSFHQVHGGASTKPDVDHMPWHEQYKALRGRYYERPTMDPLYVGRLNPAARKWIKGGSAFS